MKVSVVLAVALIALIPLASGIFQWGPKKLPVQVYFESRCPDSMRFIHNQINPIWPDIKDYIEITYIPFGKANSTVDETSGKIGFTCQHGAVECEGNMMQSCALLMMGYNKTRQLDFLLCQMVKEGVDLTGQTCWNQIQSPFKFRAVTRCINNGFGTSLQLAAEKMTKAVLPGHLFWVPTIVYNWSFDLELHTRSQTDFKGVVCELISNRSPICTTA